jgi:hypothetical protein
MSFFDKLTKAVSDTVDRGKKEVDEFMRIQKVRGEIAETERRIQSATNRIGEIEREIGQRTVALLKSGALAQPDLLAMAEPIAEFERDIETARGVIAAKNVEIEQIKAEGDRPAGPTSAPAASDVPTPPAAPTPVETWNSPGAAPDVPAPPPPVVPPPIMPPPLPTPDVAARPRFCSQCGKPVAATAATCGECGAPQ